MAAVRVVPSLDPFEHRHTGFGLGLESAPVQQFTFHGGEEAFGHGIVVGVAYRTHRWHDAHLPVAFTECMAGVPGIRSQNNGLHAAAGVATKPCSAHS